MPPPKHRKHSIFDETSSEESENPELRRKFSTFQEQAKASPRKRLRREEVASPGSLLSMFSPQEQVESLTEADKRSIHQKRVNMLGLNQIRKKIAQSRPKATKGASQSAAGRRRSEAAPERKVVQRKYSQEDEGDVDLEQSSASEEQISDRDDQPKQPYHKVQPSSMQKAAAKSMKKIQELHPALVQKKKRSVLEPYNSSGVDSDSELEEHRRNSKSKTKKRAFPYQQQFHDDGTGKKPLRARTLQFAVNLMKAEATQTTRSISQSLRERGLTDERRRLLVKAPKHSEAIIANVRQRLRTTNLPNSYSRAHDRELEDMPQVNEQRKKDIDKTGKLIAKLDQEREKLEAEYEKECERQEQLQQTLQQAQETGRADAHSLLARDTSKDDTVQKNGRKVPARKFRSAPKGTMSRLIQKMTMEGLVEQSTMCATKD